MPTVVSTLLLLFVVIVLSVLIIQHVIIPQIVNYQHGLFMNPDFTIGESRIQGLGLFTKRQRAKGEKLFIAIQPDETVTPVGSKINHCPEKDVVWNNMNELVSVIPITYLSVTPDKTTGAWWIIAARNLNVGEELTVDYTNTPDFIKKPEPQWRCDL